MKKKILIVIALSLIAFGAYQGTMAVLHQETLVSSPITAGKLGIEIINSSTKEINQGAIFEAVVPGAVIKDEVSIRNVKDKDLYVRISLTRYWVDENGKKVTNADATYIKPITKDTDEWLIIEDGNSNNEILYFYYKKPISTKQSTSNLMDEIKIDSAIKEQRYATYSATISLEAEAVQTMGAQDAILSQWGVEATFDKDGNFVAIDE